ncbi:MAG TPA: hypothetical protein VM388_04095 [Acidimicrobiales bacterium]|nr:hypothetical protein [Acidimicrobiales bacterium]
MGATAKRTTGRALALAFACTALLASALVVAAVRSDVLTGTAPAVAAAPEPCTIPEMAADVMPIPGNLGSAVFQLLTEPMPPHPDPGPMRQLHHTEYQSPAQYTEYSATLLGASTSAALEDSGFVGGASTSFEAGDLLFGAEVLQAGSPAQAAALDRRLLTDACRAGVATGIRPLAGIPGGVAYVYHDWDFPPYRAAFLVGDTLVRLQLCICEDNRGDPYTVLDAWARAMHDWTRAPLK